jgi:uncharacterized protein with PQ loop repeat
VSTTVLPLLAGSASTLIFAASYLPMLVKAFRTKDLASYSGSSLLLTNLGNAVHSFYVFSLPSGPIWALHTFYLLTSILMTGWYLHFTRGAGAARRDSVANGHDGGHRATGPVRHASGVDRHAVL